MEAISIIREIAFSTLCIYLRLVIFHTLESNSKYSKPLKSNRITTTSMVQSFKNLSRKRLQLFMIQWMSVHGNSVAGVFCQSFQYGVEIELILAAVF